MWTSKAWRARLPNLREDQLAHVERWARDNCALHAMVQDEAGRTILLGLDARPRTAASFSRTLRSVFKKRAIDTHALHGHWLRLVTVSELLPLVADGGVRAARDDARHEPPDDGAAKCSSRKVDKNLLESVVLVLLVHQ